MTRRELDSTVARILRTKGTRYATGDLAWSYGGDAKVLIADGHEVGARLYATIAASLARKLLELSGTMRRDR